MRNATICLPIKDGKILLGMKKRGFGIGKLNGFGGKQEEGEHIDDTAIRELREEIGLSATKENIRKMAEIDFFYKKKDWNQTVHIYLVNSWEGFPQESEEMGFEWHNIKNIPFERMWQDDADWLPLILNGKKIKASFSFKEDNNTVESKQINILSD